MNKPRTVLVIASATFILMAVISIVLILIAIDAYGISFNSLKKASVRAIMQLIFNSLFIVLGIIGIIKSAKPEEHKYYLYIGVITGILLLVLAINRINRFNVFTLIWLSAPALYIHISIKQRQEEKIMKKDNNDFL